jgi:uncharacterized membrane protein
MVDPALALLAIPLLAVVFGAAALAKLRDLDMFQGVVEQYRLLPAFLVKPFVRVLPVLELGAALGLLLPPTRALAAATLVGLLVLFAAAMAINLARGRSDIDCGCFIGVHKQRISWALVVRNLVLAGFGVMLLPGTTGRPLAALDWVTIGAAAASLLLLYEAIGRLFGLAPRPVRGMG